MAVGQVGFHEQRKVSLHTLHLLKMVHLSYFPRLFLSLISRPHGIPSCRVYSIQSSCLKLILNPTGLSDQTYPRPYTAKPHHQPPEQDPHRNRHVIPRHRQRSPSQSHPWRSDQETAGGAQGRGAAQERTAGGEVEARSRLRGAACRIAIWRRG